MTKDIILATELDKQNVSIDIKLANQIGNSPVMPFFLKNYAQLIDSGYAHPVMTGSNLCKAIYATDNGQVVGHIVFEILKDVFSTGWIVFSCVDDGYRGRGIYNLMHKYYEAEVKKLGATKIASFVHVNNKPRLASCASVGMEPVFYRMEKPI